MYYKVLKDNKVIDLLDQVTYLKYQPKHNVMVLCDGKEAQAILSSDSSKIWHEKNLYKIPKYAEDYDTVELQKIERDEYLQLKALNGKTPSEIIDEYTLYLIETGVI